MGCLRRVRARHDPRADHERVSPCPQCRPATGRRPSLTSQQRAEIITKAESGQGSPSQLASLFRVSRSTVQRVLREHRQGRGGA
ncbi:helix-turn-helix domain-containing protein [Sphingomonas solaris]|uniref:helix-turn-helix domain-containing protein n=1 Tax=Alterirhizorhabdus solaris TaxID=2529389 RepID=UPI0030B85E2D